MMTLRISIHAPARGATCHLDCVFSIFFRFQSTHPRGVRHKVHIGLCVFLTYFNPRTREGCDLSLLSFLSTATVFQSTHPRGVRLQSLTTFVAILLFQSTHPRGVRLNIKLFGIPTRWISIHAPARGATVILPGIFAPACLFQSTHPRGVRQKQLPPLKVCHKNFNPRTRKGCDSKTNFPSKGEKDFNPRTREGCDWVKHCHV